MNPDVAASVPTNTGAPGIVMLVIQLAIYLFFAYCMFKLAKKMGFANAWMAFIPILNAYLLVKMGGKPGWWILLYLIPIVNIIIGIMVIHGVSKARGHGVGMTLGLIFLGIFFFPYLAFTGPDKSQVPVA